MTMANIPVKYFDNTMQNAPQLTNAWGDLTALLDAILISGFNSKTPVLTRSGATGTGTIAGGHLYQVGQVLVHSGAVETDYNGEFRVLTATGTTYTFDMTGSSATSPATGTIAVKVAPLNWTTAFTATNKRAYRSAASASNKPYLRVDNALDANNTTTYAKKGKVTMAEGMSDIDTFVGAHAPYDPLLPTKNEVSSGTGTAVYDGWYKWYYTRSGNTGSDSVAQPAYNRMWNIVGDDRGFYLIVDTYGGATTPQRAVYVFTDFISYRAGDGYNTLLAAVDFYATAASGFSSGGDAYNKFNQTLEYTGKVLMKDHMQFGLPIQVGLITLGTLNALQSTGYTQGVPYPNGADYSLILHPVYLMQQTTGVLRGQLPGIMWVLNSGSPLLNNTIVENVAGYPGRRFLVASCCYATSGDICRWAFDITGPWW